MLYLISLGLYDQKDMSVKALEIARSCDKLYLEMYTTKMNIDEGKLTNFIGKEVKQLSREEIEDGKKIIEEAKTKNVGLLVGGDALVATTHISLILDAKKANVSVSIIHGSSVYSAVAESGLQLYKFGKTTTLAYPEENYEPTSFYETIKQNKQASLHTLVLLDVKADKQKYMTVKDGLEIILKHDKDHLFTEDTKLVAVAQIGGDQKIRYDSIKNLMKENFNTPAVLLIPGDLHFLEKEFLEKLDN